MKKQARGNEPLCGRKGRCFKWEPDLPLWVASLVLVLAEVVLMVLLVLAVTQVILGS